jgi:hypothetical protein
MCVCHIFYLSIPYRKNREVNSWTRNFESHRNIHLVVMGINCGSRLNDARRNEATYTNARSKESVLKGNY